MARRHISLAEAVIPQPWFACRPSIRAPDNGAWKTFEVDA